MGNDRGTVEFVRAEIISAIAEVRSVAQAEHDESRQMTADWLDAQLADVTDARGLREAAADGLSLYGGMAADSSPKENEALASTLPVQSTWAAWIFHALSIASFSSI